MFTGKSGSGSNKDTKTATNCTSEVDNKNDEDEEKCSTDSTRQQRTAVTAAGIDESTRVQQNDQDDNDESISSSNGGTTMTTSARQSLAFTIDNFNDKECDAAAQAAKYKSMMERFQNRHRRGASMSKLENDESGKAQTPTRLTSSQSSTPLTNTRSSARSSVTSEENNANSLDSDASAAQKVNICKQINMFMRKVFFNRPL